MYRLGQRLAIQQLGLIKQAAAFTPEQADIYKWLAQQRGELERAANAAGGVTPELQAQMLTNRDRMVAFGDYKRSNDPYAQLRPHHYPTPGEYRPTAPAAAPKPVAPPPAAVPTPKAAPAPATVSVKNWMGASRPAATATAAAAPVQAVAEQVPAARSLRSMLGPMKGILR